MAEEDGYTIRNLAWNDILKKLDDYEKLKVQFKALMKENRRLRKELLPTFEEIKGREDNQV